MWGVCADHREASEGHRLAHRGHLGSSEDRGPTPEAVAEF